MPGEVGFHVSPEQLVRHADSVEKSADPVEQAADAGEHVRLGAGAYGLLCSPLPGWIDPVQQTAVTAGRDQAFSLRSAADLLRDTAYRYNTSDTSADELFTNLGSALNR